MSEGTGFEGLVEQPDPMGEWVDTTRASLSSDTDDIEEPIAETQHEQDLEARNDLLHEKSLLESRIAHLDYLKKLCNQNPGSDERKEALKKHLAALNDALAKVMTSTGEESHVDASIMVEKLLSNIDDTVALIGSAREHSDD